MGWRQLNHAVHRDLGFLCIGLTLLYAVSGLLVNHTSHGFNPSYTIEHSTAVVAPFTATGPPGQAYVSQVLRELEETAPLKNVAMVAPGTMRVFVEGNTIDVVLATGKVQQEKVQRRPVLFELNFLHLNKPKGAWTWMADLYAIGLFLMALTGMLMIRGRNRQRGIILTSTGFLIPILFLLVLL
jgi:hypothetical protein